MPEDGLHDGRDEAPQVGNPDNPQQLAQVEPAIVFRHLRNICYVVALTFFRR